jgi:hypothetical protein
MERIAHEAEAKESKRIAGLRLAQGTAQGVIVGGTE